MRPDRYGVLFRQVEAHLATLGGHLNTWRTGSPLPSLDRVAAILFVLQDPLREKHPRCFAEASALAERARGDGIRLINPPEALSNSIKSVQADIWRAAGIPTPRQQPFSSRAELRGLAQKLTYPAIVRSDREHSQISMYWCQSADEVQRIAANGLVLPGTAASFWDTRDGYRTHDEKSLFAAHFHKKRAMVFGNEVVNNHLFFADDPIVGSKNSTFGHYRSLNPLRRWHGRRASAAHIAADIAYFDSPPEHAATMAAAARALDLEWCAIDYATTASGGVVLWEANPFFALRMWPFEIMPRARQVRRRMRRFGDAAGRFFATLIHEQE